MLALEKREKANLRRVREVWRIRGIVQGVGFRPTVWRVANNLGLAGEVWNDAAGVIAVVEGEELNVVAFPEKLQETIAKEAPLAHIHAIESLGFEVPTEACDFKITESQTGDVSTSVPPDAAMCSVCAREMFDPANRRWRYAFTNCTHCGPRFTITRRIPYDRASTSMAKFPMCADCQAEYDNPADRRFHAQPNACPVCGPQLAAVDANGSALPGDPIAAILEVILQGGIVALKGIGGFHLVCDARNNRTVEALRRRKGRREKAFALMCANVATARQLVDLSIAGEAALLSPAAPIVLAPKQRIKSAFSVAPSVAPDYAEWGVMLPYAPVHQLLFHEFLGRPAGGIPEVPVALLLVMTSANPGGEPLVSSNAEAFRRLSGIADAFLLHNRDIVERCDDSVVRDYGDEVRVVRCARGFTPEAFSFLPVLSGYANSSLLAVGAQQKNTITVTCGDRAYPSGHIGNLGNPETARAAEHVAHHFLELLAVKPSLIACDLHPDFASTRYAEALARAHQIPIVRVQHHHAHVAAVLAEYGMLECPAWGLVLDGMGLGTDGVAWGGELLFVKPDGTFERHGHLQEMLLPGGDRAAKEPRRMGASIAQAVGRAEVISRFWPKLPAGMTELLTHPALCTRTTSLGRLFDAAAAILGLVEVMRDEAYAATMLESVAFPYTGRVIDPGFVIRKSMEKASDVLREVFVLDFSPLMRHLIDCRIRADFCVGQCAADFEFTVAEGLLKWTEAAMARLAPQDTAHQTELVCLAGGCLLNRVLAHRLSEGLMAQGRTVLLPKYLPPGDGAVSFGQAAVASQRCLVET